MTEGPVFRSLLALVFLSAEEARRRLRTSRDRRTGHVPLSPARADLGEKTAIGEMANAAIPSTCDSLMAGSFSFGDDDELIKPRPRASS